MVVLDSVIEAIVYILQRIKQADKIKIIKLIYLADKYHLAKYGRTVTGDDYYAMWLGPVGSAVKDVLSLDDIVLSSENIDRVKSVIEKVNDHTFKSKVDGKFSFCALSETDLEALDHVINIFGAMSSRELVEYTHRYPEWSRYEGLFKGNLTKRERIDEKELLSRIEDDLLLRDIPNEHIKETKEFLEGMF